MARCAGEAKCGAFGQYAGAFGRVVSDEAGVTFMFLQIHKHGQSALRPAAERAIADAIDDFLQIVTSCTCAECAALEVFV